MRLTPGLLLLLLLLLPHLPLPLQMNVCTEVPAFQMQGAIMRRMAAPKLLNVVLAVTALRLAAYAALPAAGTPWAVLPVELLHVSVRGFLGDHSCCCCCCVVILPITPGCLSNLNSGQCCCLVADLLLLLLLLLLQGITFGVGFSTATVYSGKLAPPQLAATFQVCCSSSKNASTVSQTATYLDALQKCLLGCFEHLQRTVKSINLRCGCHIVLLTCYSPCCCCCIANVCRACGRPHMPA
jgi:hypothetical protein